MFAIKKYGICVYIVFITLALAGCKKESVFQFTPKPQVTITGAETRFSNPEIRLSKDTVYVIGSSIRIKKGQTLFIDAGTLIKVTSSTVGTSLNIDPGGKIEAAGTISEPIVFTVNVDFGRAFFGAPSAGVWNGIHIIGDGSPASSGTLSYTRIEFAGARRSALYLQNVSHQTKIDNIQISYSFGNPSFEFIGGNCNASNLIAYASSGTDFVISSGYKGKLQNLLGYRLPFYAASAPNFGGMIIQGANTLPVISNLTLLGPDTKNGINGVYLQAGSNRRAGLITVDGTRFRIRNSLITGFPLRGYYLDGRPTAVALEKLESDISYTIVQHADSTAFYLPLTVYPPYTSNDLKSFLLQPRFGNQLLPTTASLMLTDPFNYYGDGIPNPLPKEGSPLLTGADFNSPDYADPFFKKVTYRGALGTDNWLQGWTNFTPLTTDYNN